MLVKIVNEAAAIEHLKEVLSLGSSLAVFVLGSLDFTAGTLSGFMPRECHPTTKEEFDLSCGGSVAIAEQSLSRFIASRLMEQDEMIVFESYLNSSIDECIRHLSGYVVCEKNNEIYYPVVAGTNEEKINEIIRQTDNVRGPVGIIFKAETGSNLFSEAISRGQFNLIIPLVVGLVVTALDGEGWILWEASPRNKNVRG